MSAPHVQSVPSPTVEATDYEMALGTRRALSLLGGKWSVEVLYLLASGTRRYSEVLFEVGEISKKTLTQTLRSLEGDGLVSRRVYPEVPPRVEYSLTSLGWSVTGLLMTLYEWSTEHLDGAPSGRRPNLTVAPTGPVPALPAPNQIRKAA